MTEECGEYLGKMMFVKNQDNKVVMSAWAPWDIDTMKRAMKYSNAEGWCLMVVDRYENDPVPEWA